MVVSPIALSIIDSLFTGDIRRFCHSAIHIHIILNSNETDYNIHKQNCQDHQQVYRYDILTDDLCGYLYLSYIHKTRLEQMAYFIFEK